MSEVERIEIIQPQPTADNPVTVEDYPYGFRLRTEAQYWIETTKRGQRVVFRTKNPKTDRWNKPKKGTYSNIVVLYRNLENGHVETDGLTFAYTKEEDLKEFLAKFPESSLSEYQREQLIVLRAIFKTRKHLTVKIVSNPSPEEARQITENNKKTDNDLHKIFSHYYAEEKRKAKST